MAAGLTHRVVINRGQARSYGRGDGDHFRRSELASHRLVWLQ